MRWTKGAGIICGAALAVLLSALPAGANEQTLSEVERLRDAVQSIVIELTLATDLSPDRVSDLRDELQEIYRDLDALADRLRVTVGHSAEGRPGGWITYSMVDIFVDPPGARFNGWQPGVKIDFEWGDYGEIVVGVIKNGYKAKCRLLRAYSGDVSANLEALDNGDIILAVEDDLGSHQFLIEQGGLGPVYVRGREGYRPPGRDVGLLPDPYLSWARWYDPYRDLVHTDQLAESPSMEWFIAQYEADEYAPPELRELGERLALLGPGDETPLGWLTYELAGKPREMEIVDPRHNPADFAHMISELHQCASTGEYFQLSIRW